MGTLSQSLSIPLIAPYPVARSFSSGINRANNEGDSKSSSRFTHMETLHESSIARAIRLLDLLTQSLDPFHRSISGYPIQ